MRDLIAVALGFKPPPWVQVRTIVGTVAVEDGKYVYSGAFTAQAEFTPKVITNETPLVKVRPTPPRRAFLFPVRAACMYSASPIACWDEMGD